MCIAEQNRNPYKVIIVCTDSDIESKRRKETHYFPSVLHTGSCVREVKHTTGLRFHPGPVVVLINNYKVLKNLILFET